MELVDEKHVHQCVSTEKADEITSAHDMKTELSEWFATHKGRKWESRGRKEDPLADPISFECGGGVRDKWMDVTVPNISGICQVVFPKMFNCSEPLKLRTGALPLRFATPGYFQNMNRGRNVAEFDSIAPTVQGGIPMTVNVNREGSACAQGPFAIQSWARRACPGSATGFRRACSPIRGH